MVMEYDKYKTESQRCVEEFEQIDRFFLAQRITGLTTQIALLSLLNGIISSFSALLLAAYLSGNLDIMGYLTPIFGKYSSYAYLFHFIIVGGNFAWCKFHVEECKTKRDIAYLFLENRIEDFVRTGKSFSVRDYHTKETMIH